MSLSSLARIAARPSLLVLLLGLLAACGDDDDDNGGGASGNGGSSSSCTCALDINGDQRTLTCGQSACVGGTTYKCGADASISQAGACSDGAGGAGGAAGQGGASGEAGAAGEAGQGGDSGAGGEAGGTTTSECDSLATYCDTKCSGSATVYKNCKDTAAKGNESTCISWISVNGSLCK